MAKHKSVRKSGWISKCCIIATFLFLAACSERVLQLDGIDLHTPAKVSIDQVSGGIKRAAHLQGWQVIQLSPNRIEATLRYKVHVLVVDITHTRERMSIHYKDSRNIPYDGVNIHRNANSFIKKLEMAIIRHTSTLDASSYVPKTQHVGSYREPSSPTKRHSTGSGFVISKAGYVLTNDHVVKDCSELRVGESRFSVIRRDDQNDLAVIKGSVGEEKVAAVFRQGRGVRLGEDIYVVGFPAIGTFRTGMNVTKGTISALATTSFLQMTAPIQPGSSGGPILDNSGNVVGAVMAKLSALTTLRATGSLPENVNFGVNGVIIKAFSGRRACSL